MMLFRTRRWSSSFGLLLSLTLGAFTAAAAEVGPAMAEKEEMMERTPASLQIPDWRSAYPFSARNLPLETALKLFAKNLRIGFALAEGLEGEIVKATPSGMNRLEYIEALALEFDFVWYFDGSLLRVSPVGATETRVLPLEKHEGDQVIESLRALDIYQPKFLHRYGPRSRTLRVTGPVDYIELVESAVEAIDNAERETVRLMRGNVVRALDSIDDGS